MVKRLIIAGIIVALFLGGVAYFQFVLKPEMIRGFIAKAAPPPATVSAEPARVETWVQRLTSIGTLKAVQAIEVSSQVPGIVKEILFEGGVQVQAFDPLVRLDTEVEKADLASSRATLHQAELAYKRQVDLARKGTAPQSQLDEAEAARDTAKAAVDRIQALIDQKTITAPFSGRLGVRQVDLGQYVSPGKALVTLQSLDPIYADFPIPEQHAALLETGQRIEATFDAFPDMTFTGQIVILDARVNDDTRTLLVRALIPNHQRKLLPGMFANVAVLVGQPHAVVTVPRTAVSYSLYGDSVFVVKSEPASANEEQKDESAQPKTTVERRFVRVGEVRDDRVAILEGISKEETIVTSGQLKLESGGAVKVDNSGELKPLAQKPKL